MSAGFALSASIFSTFLYITLFFQNVLGYSPFEAGLRSLPVTMPILFVSPLSGRLTARVPVRLLLGTGLAFVTVGLLLMAHLSDSSGWTALLPGQILAGIGIGMATPALASTAVGVVPPQLSGMASGASNTARQLGLATGIAGLGSIFQAKIESTLTPLIAGTPASAHVHELARAVASGGTGHVLHAVPPAAQAKVTHAAHHAFVTGFNTIALVSVAVAALGAVAAYALVRPRDFVGPGHPTQAPSEPAPAHHDLDIPNRVTPPIPDTLSHQDALPSRGGATANAGLDPSGATHLLAATNRDPSHAGGLPADGPILTPQPTDSTRGWKG